MKKKVYNLIHNKIEKNVYFSGKLEEVNFKAINSFLLTQSTKPKVHYVRHMHLFQIS